MMIKPLRGDIWLVNLDPVVGHEQAKKRPCLVVSTDIFNCGAAGLVGVMPVTSRHRKLSWHVCVQPPEGGLNKVSYIQCDQMRVVSKQRFAQHKLGIVTPVTMQDVAYRLRIFFEL